MDTIPWLIVVTNFYLIHSGLLHTWVHMGELTHATELKKTDISNILLRMALVARRFVCIVDVISLVSLVIFIRCWPLLRNAG